MGELLRKKRNFCRATRDHDYLFDSTFVVSGQKDHNKLIKKAGIATAQMSVMPVFDQMFSELKCYPRVQKVFIPYAHLPPHIDLSYFDRKCSSTNNETESRIISKERFKFFSAPKVPLSSGFNNGNIHMSTQISPQNLLVNKAVQTIYRDSAVQTDPYQPQYKIRDGCKQIPEVLLLDEINIDVKWLKKGIDKSIVQSVNTLKAKRAWLEIYPTNQRVLTELQFYEDKHRKKDIEDALKEKLSLEFFFESFTKVDTKKPERMWFYSEEKINKEIEKIRKNKERVIRKLDTKKLQHNLKTDNINCNIQFQPKMFLIDIDSNFLPSFKKLENKKFTFEKPMFHYNRTCSKNEKYIIKIHNEIQQLINEDLTKHIKTEEINDDNYF